VCEQALVLISPLPCHALLLLLLLSLIDAPPSSPTTPALAPAAAGAAAAEAAAGATEAAAGAEAAGAGREGEEKLHSSTAVDDFSSARVLPLLQAVVRGWDSVYSFSEPPSVKSIQALVRARGRGRDWGRGSEKERQGLEQGQGLGLGGLLPSPALTIVAAPASSSGSASASASGTGLGGGNKAKGKGKGKAKTPKPTLLLPLPSSYTDPAPASASASASASAPLYMQVDLSLLPTRQEWSFATLLCYTPSSVLLKLVNLLLMEVSVVVVGPSSASVSVAVTALQVVLSPFRWEGLVVTLCPSSLTELLGAPVPLLVGTTGAAPPEHLVNASSAVLVLTEEPASPQPSNGGRGRGSGSSSGRGSGSSGRGRGRGGGAGGGGVRYGSFWGRLPEVRADMPINADFARQIDTTRAVLLSSASASASASASGAGAGFLASMSLTDRQVTLRLLRALRDHNLAFVGECARPDQIARFSRKNEPFSAAAFVEPLRARVEFCEVLVQTQHFSGFLDRTLMQWEQRAGPAALIRDWLSYRLLLRSRGREGQGGR